MNPAQGHRGIFGCRILRAAATEDKRAIFARPLYRHESYNSFQEGHGLGRCYDAPDVVTGYQAAEMGVFNPA